MTQRSELREMYGRWRPAILMAAVVAALAGLYWGYAVLGPLLVD